jgi:allantoin racemase
MAGAPRAIRLLYIVPVPVSDEELSLRRQQLPPGLLHPSTEVVFEQVRFSGTGAYSFYDDLFVDLGVVDAGAAAEDRGFDAVCIDTVSDAGVTPLRSRLTIPVIGPGEAAAHVCSILGGRLGIVATTGRWSHFYEKNFTLYGLRHKLGAVEAAGLTPAWDLYVGPQRETAIAAVVAAAERLVADRGCDVVMIGSTTMSPTVPALSEALDVPVVSPAPWACRLAETCVLLGVSHSKKTYESPAQPLDHLLSRLAPGDAEDG